MPPEMWLRKSYGHEVDMWSMGVSLCVLVTGMLPFRGDSLEELGREICYTKLAWDRHPFLLVSDACCDLLEKVCRNVRQ